MTRSAAFGLPYLENINRLGVINLLLHAGRQGGWALLWWTHQQLSQQAGLNGALMQVQPGMHKHLSDMLTVLI